MANKISPLVFDEELCRITSASSGSVIDPQHILVNPAQGNLLKNDDNGLRVTGDSFISAEEGNIAKVSQADGGVLVKAADMVSDAECNAISVNADGKLELKPEDLISDVNGGNPLGINPDDCKLFINPCLLPGPQNIVSNVDGNLIVKDPDDCSALLKFNNVVSEDAGNLIQPGTDGKLHVGLDHLNDRGYLGAGLVYVEKQDGSHSLQVAACDGLWFESGTIEDASGNAYEAKWLKVRLDDDQNILFFKNETGCTECFTSCDSLSIGFSLNSANNRLRILDHGGAVYTQIPLENGLESLASGGITINTLDDIGKGTSDLPISAKAIKAMVSSSGKGGLVWNEQNLLEVDFSQMPEDKIESIVAAMRVPIVLGANDTEFYVNINSSNAKDIFRESYTDANGNAAYRYYGRSPEYPWKTIRGGTSLLAENYNINTRTVHINITPAAGDNSYSGSVPLAYYPHTTGTVVLRPVTAGQRYQIVVSTEASAECLNHTGGSWYVDDADLKLLIGNSVRSSPVYPNLIQSTDSVGQLHLRGTNFEFEDGKPASGSGVYARLLNINGGRVAMTLAVPRDGVTETHGGVWKGTKGNSNVRWLYIENGGLLEMGRAGSGNPAHEYNVTGAFSIFANVINGGMYRLTGTGPDPLWAYTAATDGNDNPLTTAAGKRYAANYAGVIITGKTTTEARDVYFPGNAAGTMDTKYSAWVSPLADADDDSGDGSVAISGTTDYIQLVASDFEVVTLSRGKAIVGRVKVPPLPSSYRAAYELVSHEWTPVPNTDSADYPGIYDLHTVSRNIVTGGSDTGEIVWLYADGLDATRRNALVSELNSQAPIPLSDLTRYRITGQHYIGASSGSATYYFTVIGSEEDPYSETTAVISSGLGQSPAPLRRSQVWVFKNRAAEAV